METTNIRPQAACTAILKKHTFNYDKLHIIFSMGRANLSLTSHYTSF